MTWLAIYLGLLGVVGVGCVILQVYRVHRRVEELSWSIALLDARMRRLSQEVRDDERDAAQLF